MAAAAFPFKAAASGGDSGLMAPAEKDG